MPLPPALAARLAKRGLIQTSTSAAVRNKENSADSGDRDRPRFVEEVIAESYDDPKGQGHSSASGGHGQSQGQSSISGPTGANTTPLGGLSLGNRKLTTTSGSIGPTTGITKFHRMGHYGCPNKVNIHHSCTQWCVTRWGRGQIQPTPSYNRRRLRMLKKYPLPSNWIEIYDPGTGRYYYWNTDTDDTAWLSPTSPKAVVGRAAPEMREKMIAEELAEANKPTPSQSEVMKKSLKKLNKPSMDSRRRKGKEREELDPMDPSAYSDVPRGNWASGLRNEVNTGVDSTASGPLFQQRPYPSPGDILKANRKPTT